MLPDKYRAHQPAVRKMRSDGLSYRKIADALGFSATTAWRLAADEHEARYEESNRASCERRAVPA